MPQITIHIVDADGRLIPDIKEQIVCFLKRLSQSLNEPDRKSNNIDRPKLPTDGAGILTNCSGEVKRSKFIGESSNEDVKLKTTAVGQSNDISKTAPEWKITKAVSISKIKFAYDTVVENSKGYWGWEGPEVEKGCSTYESMLSAIRDGYFSIEVVEKGILILSVKDWVIVDSKEVPCHGKPFQITAIKMGKSTPCLFGEGVGPNGISIENDIRKLEILSPLFKSAEGKDVYINDQVCVVDKRTLSLIEGSQTSLPTKPENYKIFTEKKNAEQFVKRVTGLRNELKDRQENLDFYTFKVAEVKKDLEELLA